MKKYDNILYGILAVIGLTMIATIMIIVGVIVDVSKEADKVNTVDTIILLDDSTIREYFNRLEAERNVAPKE